MGRANSMNKERAPWDTAQLLMNGSPLMPASFYGLLGLVLTISAWTNILFLLAFMHKHLDFLEQCLSGNKCVINTKSLWGGGVIGRLMRLGMVFIVISMPGFMYARGEAMKDAHQSIPRHLKRWMWGIHIALLTNFIVSMALACLIKISERS
jgi:hypothetical protein